MSERERKERILEVIQHSHTGIYLLWETLTPEQRDQVDRAAAGLAFSYLKPALEAIVR